VDRSYGRLLLNFRGWKCRLCELGVDGQRSTVQLVFVEPVLKNRYLLAVTTFKSSVLDFQIGAAAPSGDIPSRDDARDIREFVRPVKGR
jgi:hypothetical protein